MDLEPSISKYCVWRGAGCFGIIEDGNDAGAVEGVLWNAVYAAGLFDAACLEHGRHDVDRVAKLLADLAAAVNATGPANKQGRAGAPYRSISRFRRRHLRARSTPSSSRCLALCAEAGLVKLGRVALDGTKLRASASRHKAMSYDAMRPRLEELEAQVAAMLAEAEATDAGRRRRVR